MYNNRSSSKIYFININRLKEQNNLHKLEKFLIPIFSMLKYKNIKS